MLEFAEDRPVATALRTYAITLMPSGNGFNAQPGESLLDAAARAGLLLPHQCKAGTCGACKARVVVGSTQMLLADTPALSPDEAAQGVRLLCCTSATSAVQVECAEIPHIPGIEVRKLPVRVAAIDRLAPDVVRLQLQPPAGTPLHYACGQYVNVLLPGNRRRSYSMASPPGRGPLELHIRHLPGGLFTDQVFGKLKARDVLRIEGPFGTFGMHTPSDEPAVLLASGTGFAPIKALVEQLIAQGSRRSVHLYWGGRTRQDLYLNTLCEQWQQALPGQLHYVPVLSDAASTDDWRGRTGFVHQAVMQDLPDLSGHEVFACGAPPMVDAARRDFAAYCGMRPTAFFADAFVAQSD